MKIRQAKKSDLENIMKMYSSCVKGMIKNNITQWDKSYPNINIIKSDIINQTYFVAEIKREIVGGVNIDKNQDKTYLNIQWNDINDKFLVVHRLGVKEEMWKCKIGKKIMIFVEKLALEKKLHSIRLDTYSENPIAISFYKKIGYKQLGSINLKPNKNEYYCFEKILK